MSWSVPKIATSAASASSLSASTLAVIYDYNSVFYNGQSKIFDHEEFDDRVIDGVTVSLYTRNVNFDSSSSSCVNACQHGTEFKAEHYRHWVLIFFSPNSERYVTYEAENQNNILVCKSYQVPPCKVDGDKLYENIAKCKTSPKKLQELARSIKYNNMRYNLCFRNCQIWIKSFAEAIGGEVFECICKRLKTISEKEPLVSSLAGPFHAVYCACKDILFTKEESNGSKLFKPD